jgi:hypothetical protein
VVDVYDSARLATVLIGQEALISAFNPGWKDPNLYADQVRGTASILQSAKTASLKRVLWVGGAGGLFVKPGVRVIDAPDFPPAIKPGSLATIEALEQLRREPSLLMSAANRPLSRARYCLCVTGHVSFVIASAISR